MKQFEKRNILNIIDIVSRSTTNLIWLNQLNRIIKLDYQTIDYILNQINRRNKNIKQIDLVLEIIKYICNIIIHRGKTNQQKSDYMKLIHDLIKRLYNNSNNSDSSDNSNNDSNENDNNNTSILVKNAVKSTILYNWYHYQKWSIPIELPQVLVDIITADTPKITTTTNTIEKESTSNMTIPYYILKNIFWKLFKDESFSLKWKLMILPLVSWSCFNIVADFLANSPFTWIEIHSSLNVGSKYCLFRNPPLHLNDYEIFLIPLSKRLEAIANLKSLSQTHIRVKDTWNGQYHVINYHHHTSKLESIQVVETTHISTRGIKFYKYFNGNTSPSPLYSADLEQKHQDNNNNNNEKKYSEYKHFCIEYLAQLTERNVSTLRNIHFEYTMKLPDGIIGYLQKIVDYTKDVSGNSILYTFGSHYSKASLDIYQIKVNNVSDGTYRPLSFRLRQLDSRMNLYEIRNVGFGIPNHIIFEICTVGERLIGTIIDQLFGYTISNEKTDLSNLKRLDLRLLGAKEIFWSLTKGNLMEELNNFFSKLLDESPLFKHIEVVNLYLCIGNSWDSTIDIPLLNDSLVGSSKVDIQSFHNNDNYTKFVRFPKYNLN